MSEDGAKRAVKTRQGDTVEVEENHILRVKDGVIGFPGMETFALIPQGEESPFIWLQSLEDPGLAFILIDPRVFFPDYKPPLSPGDLKAVGLDTIADAGILTIVVIPANPREMTTNLLAPLVINLRSREARQMISQSAEHQIRHRLLRD